MAQTRSAATPTRQSQPPKSRSVSAKGAQGTSSRLTRSRSRELGESPAPASFKVPSLPLKRDEVGDQKPVPKTPRASDASTRGNSEYLASFYPCAHFTWLFYARANLTTVQTSPLSRRIVLMDQGLASSFLLATRPI